MEQFASAVYTGESVGQWQPDPELSSRDYTTYTRPGSKEAILAFSGTRPLEIDAGWGEGQWHPTNLQDIFKSAWYSPSFRDLSTDIILLSGNRKYSHRVYRANQVTKAAIEKYGKENVRLTGHSLGGQIAMEMSERHDLPANVYNPFVLWEDVKSKRKYPKVHARYNFSDPVSMLTPLSQIGSIEATYNKNRLPGFGQHGIE